MSRRAIWLVAAAVVAAIGLGLAAYFSPIMSVRSVSVSGTERLTPETVQRVAAVGSGVPLLQVDTAVIADRVAAIPEVESARVARSYPSEISIEIVERIPTVRVIDGDSVRILDRGGVDYLDFPADRVPEEFGALPEFVADQPGPTDPSTSAAIAAVAGMPQWLRDELVRVEATSPAAISLVLVGDRLVIWGDAERGEAKAETLRHLLTVEGTHYNVSSPEFPAVR